jgi:drug/metabolite transporter (DMT)-like permease
MFSTSKFIRRVWIGVQVLSSIVLIVLTKNLLSTGVNPLVMTMEMLIIGGLLLLMLILIRGEKVRWLEIKQILPAGIIGGCLAFWLGFVGLSMTQASNYSFLTRFTTVFTCILSFIFLKEDWGINKTVVIIMVMFGSFLMSTSGHFTRIGLGDVLVMGSSFFYSVSYVLVAKAMKNVSALATSAYRSLSGGIALLIICMVSNQKPVAVDLKILTAGLVVALAVLSAHKIIRVANASYMVLITSLIPVATTLIMIIFFGEHLTNMQVLGGGVLLLGSWMTEFKTI